MMQSGLAQRLGFGLLVLVGCSGSEPTVSERPRPSPTTSSIVPGVSALPPVEEPTTPTTVKTTGGFVVSPDGSLLATPASDPAERAGVAIHRLVGERAGSVSGFFAIGEAEMEFWLDATHAVATGSNAVWVLDLERGAATKLEGMRSPIVTGDRSRVVALDAEMRPVIFEAPTLSERVTLDVKLGQEPLLRFGAGDTLVLAAGFNRSVVATLDGTVKLDLPIGSFADDRTGLSARGGYLTRLVSGEGVAMIALFEVSTGKEIYRSAGSMYPGSIAVSRDETMAVASDDPSSAVRIELPSGRTRKLSGDKWDTEGYGYFTGRMGITEDGRFACGFPLTTIGKYTNCNEEILFTLGRTGKPRGAHVGCHVWPDGSATLVTIPSASVGAKRHPIPNISATYTHLCNSNISLDRSRISLAVVPNNRPSDSMRYDDVELLVLRVADGAIENSFELGAGPSSTGAVLNHQFSPTGRFVRVEWGEGNVRVFDRTTNSPVDRVFSFEPTDTVFAVSATELLVMGNPEPVALALMEGSTLTPRQSF